jgi:hypothetical protein
VTDPGSSVSPVERVVSASFATRDPSPLLPAVRDLTGSAWRLGRRLPGGAWGAWRLTDPAGRRAVLKCIWDIDWRPRVVVAAAVVDRVRARGLPVPLIHHWGFLPGIGTWLVADYLPGRTLSQLDPVILPQALAFIDQLRGCAVDVGNGFSWSEEVARTLRPRSHAQRVLRGAGGDAAELARVAAPYRVAAEHLSHDDAVHGDLVVTQLLVDRTARRLAGVIDWDQAARGSRAIDLALLFQNVHVQGDRTGAGATPEVLSAIARAGVDAAGPGFVAAVHAHLVEMVAFVVEHNPRHVPWRLDVAARVRTTLRGFGLA